MSDNIVSLSPVRDQLFLAREQRLMAQLAAHPRLIVSFSGRMESCYAMELCRAAGVSVRAFTVDSPNRSRRDIARSRRYCEYHGIDQVLLKSEEMIFFDHDGIATQAPDPVRWLSRFRDAHPGLATIPLLVAASVEDAEAYRAHFGPPPANTLWTFAEEGMTTRDFRYGFHQRQLAVWGSNETGCLSLRFSSEEDMDGDRLRMVDMAEQILADMGLPEARVFFHYLSDGESMLGRVRVDERELATAFDRREEILGALQACGFDLVTLDLHRMAHDHALEQCRP
ncbi:adenine nucleotide alpha-hydrolase family protein [Aeromonas schubertii]|uniref:hypothetical protein n=1 Tax=Aeromonas schubertii TaxID=652 RepID=UPI0010A7E002|nr:hypothetical protein [Aeromonas schubertii]QCG47402.1 hypothetical protein E2P79_05675 [Aeromonas schubertii]